jgi:LEA14-like dessication related protein
MTMKQPVFLVTLLVLLAGCGTLQPGFETPTVTVTSFKSVPSGGAMPAFEIGLRVINPNREALELVGASYTVSLEGRDVIKGVANDLPVIDGYGEGTFTLNASADLLAGARLVTDLLKTERDSFRYELEARLDVGGLRPKIRVREAGEIALWSKP